jgi:hypothetical protein
MKKFSGVLVALALVFSQHMAFAQTYGDSGFTEEGIGIPTAAGGGGSSQSSQSVYHLLILDRTAAVNSDISGVDKDALLYKAKHGRTGYLIALYKVSPGGKEAGLPSGAYVVVDLVTSRKTRSRNL